MVMTYIEGRGMFGIPMTLEEVTEEDLLDFFPVFLCVFIFHFLLLNYFVFFNFFFAPLKDEEVLADWKSGKRTEWPRRPTWRFEIGARVSCRIGPNPVTGWASGRVVALNYSEANWPPGSYVPYQIWLHDGRLIFAPQDTDEVIRLRDAPEADSPPSPPLPDYLLDSLEDDGMDDEETSDVVQSGGAASSSGARGDA